MSIAIDVEDPSRLLAVLLAGVSLELVVVLVLGILLQPCTISTMLLSGVCGIELGLVVAGFIVGRPSFHAVSSGISFSASAGFFGWFIADLVNTVFIRGDEVTELALQSMSLKLVSFHGLLFFGLGLLFLGSYMEQKVAGDYSKSCLAGSSTPNTAAIQLSDFRCDSTASLESDWSRNVFY